MSSPRHLSTEQLSLHIEALPPPPADEGEIALVVVRPSEGARLLPDRCLLTPERGVEGDRWLLRDKPLPAAQISVMRTSAARALAGTQPLSLFGDNLFVELDLSAENLPVGARVQVGSALCVVTDKPHTGCVKFGERFGQDARDILTADRFRAQRLRGIYFRVIEAGEVAPGDRVRVLSRSAAG